MKKLVIAVLVMLFYSVAFTQENTLTIEGKIIAPSGEDVEGISIYNTSTKKGTITDAKGNFNIDVSINDRLIIMAVQFGERIFVMDDEAINTQKLVFYLNPSLQVLDEILIRSHDLTGNLDLDAKNIKTYSLGIGAMGPWKAGRGLPEIPDSQTSFKQNVALDALGATTSQANLAPLFKPLFNALFPKRVKKITYPEETVSEKLYNLLDKEYFVEVLQLQEDEMSAFLLFIEEKEIPENLLANDSSIRLMEHLQGLIAEYRALAMRE